MLSCSGNRVAPEMPVLQTIQILYELKNVTCELGSTLFYACSYELIEVFVVEI